MILRKFLVKMGGGGGREEGRGRKFELVLDVEGELGGDCWGLLVVFLEFVLFGFFVYFSYYLLFLCIY